MKNKLTEQQIQAQLLAEFDAINKLGRGLGRVAGSAAKSVGAVAGGVAGLGSAVKKGYQAGKQTVGGGGANIAKGQTTQQAQPKAQAGAQATNTQAQPKAQPKAQAGAQVTNTQAQTQIKKPGLLKRVGGAVSTVAGKADALAQKTLDKVNDVSNYDWRQDDAIKDRSKQTYTGVGGAQIGQNPSNSNLSQKNQAAGATNKRAKTGGKVAGQTSTTASAQKQRDARAAKKGSAIGKGIDQAQVDKNKDGRDDKTGKPMAPAPAPTGKGPTSGAGGAAAQVDKNKDGKDDKTGKPMSKTATDVKNKTGVKAGGVKMDPNNPQHQALIAAIEKASPGTTKAIDALDPPSKEKLKKAIA